ncbi:MAG TPA: hypothetical protein VF142_10280 [Longimicrobium sp.]
MSSAFARSTHLAFSWLFVSAAPAPRRWRSSSTTTSSGFAGRTRRRTWVAQGEAAFGVRWRRTEPEYRFVLRGGEYATQETPHPFGSIRLRVPR